MRDLAKYKDEQEKSEKLFEEKTLAVEKLTKEIQQINSDCSALEADLEDEKSGIIDIVRRTAQLHNELQSIGQYRDNLSNQKDRLSGRADTAEQELEKLLALAQKMHRSAFDAGAERVVTTMRIDERRDKPITMEGKIKAVKEKLDK